jgi:hypothetical protein
MTPLDPTLRSVLDELANGLQVVVLVAEHLQQASSATAQDATAIARNLKRVTDALHQLRTDGGVR